MSELSRLSIDPAQSDKQETPEQKKLNREYDYSAYWDTSPISDAILEVNSIDSEGVVTKKLISAKELNIPDTIKNSEYLNIDSWLNEIENFTQQVKLDPKIMEEEVYRALIGVFGDIQEQLRQQIVDSDPDNSETLLNKFYDSVDLSTDPKINDEKYYPLKVLLYHHPINEGESLINYTRRLLNLPNIDKTKVVSLADRNPCFSNTAALYHGKIIDSDFQGGIYPEDLHIGQSPEMLAGGDQDIGAYVRMRRTLRENLVDTSQTDLNAPPNLTNMYIYPFPSIVKNEFDKSIEEMMIKDNYLVVCEVPGRISPRIFDILNRKLGENKYVFVTHDSKTGKLVKLQLKPENERGVKALKVKVRPSVKLDTPSNLDQF